MPMTDEEYYKIKMRVDAGESVKQACRGNEAQRVAYIRMKAKKESSRKEGFAKHPHNELEFFPIQEAQAQEAQEQENYSDEDYAQVVPNWYKLPAITKELWKKNLAIARKPGASPQNANIHAKTMVALCPEFREKKERTVFTPDDYRKVWEEATESIRNGDKIETYEEYHEKMRG